MRELRGLVLTALVLVSDLAETVGFSRVGGVFTVQVQLTLGLSTECHFLHSKLLLCFLNEASNVCRH